LNIYIDEKFKRFWVPLRLLVNEKRGFVPLWIRRIVPKLRIIATVILFYTYVVMACKGTVLLHVGLCYMLILAKDYRGINTAFTKKQGTN
jgi:hypothetical protein